MAAKKLKNDLSNSAFDIDKLVDEICKETDIKPVNIQRGSFIENSISSGSLSMDLILGGGWQGGRFSIMVGPEGGGKSTFSFYMMKEAILKGIPVFHFDYEGATDPTYAGRIGLRVDWSKEKQAGERVFYRNFQLDTGEEAFIWMHRILKGMPDMPTNGDGGIQAVFVLDSLPAMNPAALDLNDEAGGMALQARMFSRNIPLIKTLVSKKNCLLFATNQLREKPGVSYGDPFYEPSGNAPKQYSDVRVRITNRSVPPPGKGQVQEEACWDERGTDKYRYSIIRTVKNKMFSPFRETWSRFWFEERGAPGPGVDPVFDAYQYLTMTGQVEPVRGQKHIIHMPEFENKEPMTWPAFKILISNPALQNKENSLRTLCLNQLQSGDGFQKYFDTAGKVGIAAKEEMDEETGEIRSNE